MSELRALTVRQPWASAIAYGGKDIENRSWETSYRGLIAIHAGKGVDWNAPDEAWTAAGLTPYRPGAGQKYWTASLPLGAVIATATLKGSHQDDCASRWCRCSPWAQPGQCHWELADVRPLASPVPCKGALGLWRLPRDAEAAVREQMGETDA